MKKTYEIRELKSTGDLKREVGEEKVKENSKKEEKDTLFQSTK
jgi:hypothetical protein